MKRILFWTPRVLALLFAGFISLFALDVFGAGYGFWEAIEAFLIHLIPTGIILIALAIAWRWEWLGAVLFAALGIAYVIVAWGQSDWVAYAVISGPAFLIAALFLVSRLTRLGLGSSS